MRYSIILLCAIILCGCGEKAEDLLTTSIDADFSHIEDSRARWEAYQLEDYVIQQNRSCECLPPTSYKVVVRNGKVVDILYEKLEHTYGKDPEELYRNALASAKSVDEVFDLLQREKDGAARFEVEFHSRFGYPTKIFIDPNIQMIDGEIRISMSQLEQIVN